MTTIQPGRPNVPGTAVGALIIGVLTNGLTLLGATYYIQDIVLGAIIIASVAVSASQMRRAAFGVPR
jgi:ribose transport system permease protein